MTISSETSKSGPYLGNGSTKIFDYQFKIVDETHLTVIKRDTSGVESTLILNTDYTVADVGQASGGQVTLDVAPAVGETITILRNVPFTQETDLENQGAYYAETVEAAFDLMVMRDQQLQEQIDRAVRIPASADPSALDSLVEDIIRLSVSADEIDTVANIAGDVSTVAANNANITTVANNLTDVTNFAKVYLGPKSSDPALRNDGSPLQAGDLYFNTAANGMRVYDGAAWRETSPQSLNMNAKSFTGDGVETEFTLNLAPVIAENVLVWVGGVRQVPGVDYTVSGTTLTFASAPNGAVDTLVIATVSELNLAVSYAPQTLAPEQQEQARENIGATEVGHALFTAASKDAARDAIGAADAPVITDVRAVAYDMHFRILRGQGWTTGEAGGVVAYELASPAAAGATSITLTSGSPKPITSQILVYLGDDGEYYSAVVSGVTSNTVRFKTPLEAGIAAGENVFNFYVNESHPNTYGYRAIADDMLRSGLHAWKEVFRGAPAEFAGTVVPYNVDNAANPGSSAGGGYKVTPSQDNGGCYWAGFVAPRTGRYRAEIHCNRGGGAGGQAVTLHVLINGSYKYSKVVHGADVSPTFIDFSVMDGTAVQFRALKNQQYDFFISDLIVYERDGAGINLEAFKSGRHLVFGDSWAAVSTDIGQGIGIIDRLRERFPSATFVNKGVGGNRASDLVSRFDADIAADVAANGPAKTMLVICGTNDYYGAVDPIVFGDNLGIVAAKAVALGIAPIMFTSSVGSHLESPARHGLSRRYALEVALVDRSIDTLGTLTFTPVLRGATSAGTGTYAVQQGRYRRSGKQIDFAINLNWSDHDGTGAMEIIGLPLPASGLAFPCTVVYGNLSYTSPIQAYVVNDKIVIGQAASGAGFNPMAISSAGLLYVSGTYFTA